MPARERVAALVAAVEASNYVEAIREFYAEDATMQENLGDKRVGRDALIAGEEGFLKSIRSIVARPGSRFAIDGDFVVIHWVFDITLPDGRTFAFDELVHQIWRGDRIATERFYYDPSQRNP